MGVDERNAKALLQTITDMDKRYGDRITALEILSRSLLNQMSDLQHRLNVLIQTNSSTGPTAKDDG